MTINADQKNVLTVSPDFVTKIQVEKIVPPSEDDIDESCFRTIRFTTSSGEVLEVFCHAGSVEDLELVEVDELKPVRPRRARRSDDWLKPSERDQG